MLEHTIVVFLITYTTNTNLDNLFRFDHSAR